MRVEASASIIVLCFAAGALAAQQPGTTPEPARPRPSTSAAKTSGSTAGSAGSRSALEEFSATIQRLIADVNTAVVEVVAEGFGEPEAAAGGRTNAVSRQTREGTGVMVSADGDLVTNAHVVTSARSIQVRIGDQPGGSQRSRGRSRMVPAQITGIDRETDLALLKIPAGNRRTLKFADSSQLRQGQVVFAVGSPMGLENSVSMGIVSAVDRQLDADASQAYVQTDAPINPGNSGGPLINTRGEIVGINTFIFSSSGGNEGLGFAIPSNLVRDVYAQLKRYGRVRRGELGVVVRSVTPVIAKALNLPRDRGVLVQDVVPGKAAADAGIQINDIVVRVEGRSVWNLRQFSNSLFRSEIGGKLRVEVLRGDARAELSVAFLERNDDVEKLLEQIKEKASPIAQLGILAVPLDRDTAALVSEPRYAFGTIVAAKLQAPSSFQEELEPGDVILGINGQSAKNIEALTDLIKRLPEHSPLVVQVQRQGVLRYLVLSGE